MERPDITKPFVGPGKHGKMVARTQSIEEANKIAEQYQMQGFETYITKIKQGEIALYEVWVTKEPDILTGKKS